MLLAVHYADLWGSRDVKICIFSYLKDVQNHVYGNNLNPKSLITILCAQNSLMD